MKKMLCLVLAMMLCSAGAVAQEYVSVAELYDQVQAMGGWWKETFDTPNGEVTVDAPIIVPDIEEIPVLTVSKVKPLTKELFDVIAQGERSAKPEGILEFKSDISGEMLKYFLGYEEDGKTGYDAVEWSWVYHGDWNCEQVNPATYHYPWEIDEETAYLRGSEQTIADVMKIWEEDIQFCYPNGEYAIKPKRIIIRGSNLVDNQGTDKASKRNGYYLIYAEQYFNELPLFGAIASTDGNNKFGVNHGSDTETNRIYEELHGYRTGSVDACADGIIAYSPSDDGIRTLTELNGIETIEHEDVPLISLDEVQRSIAEEIEKGHIRRIYSIRLGYLLYSNPDMTEYAWAIPRWVVDCDYVTDANKESVEEFHAMDDGWMNVWNSWEFVQMPVDAQNGELIIFTTGDAETFCVPDVLTWDDVK